MATWGCLDLVYTFEFEDLFFFQWKHKKNKKTTAFGFCLHDTCISEQRSESSGCRSGDGRPTPSAGEWSRAWAMG